MNSTEGGGRRPGGGAGRGGGGGPGLYLVALVAEVDICGVSTAYTFVAVDEAHVGRGHLQQGISPHMLIFGAAYMPPSSTVT